MSSNLFTVLEEKLSEHENVCTVIVNKYPWIIPTIIGRVYEEFGTQLFTIITDPYIIEYVRDSLQHIKDFDVTILADYEHGLPLIHDNVFDTIFRFNKLFKIMADKVRGKVIIDLTGSDGLIASTAMYSASRILGEKATYTLIENIPLYGIPAYPGSPRWLHKLYVYGQKENGLSDPGISYPKMIEWRGSRGIYIAFSKMFNALTPPGYYEYYYENKREFSKNESYMEVYSHSNTSFENKQKLVVVNEVTGPDENTSRMLYNAWRIISDLLVYDYGEREKQGIDRIIMQVQRYVGAADLVVKQVASHNNHHMDWVGDKLHRILMRYASEKQPVALVPDTNLFYQGIHMTLLKASIRAGAPWSRIRGLSIYVPKCAETEINGKVAELNADTEGLQRLSYIMALLANRALLETKYYYGGETLNAVAQPCEVAVAVEASTLPEPRILLVTADHKAFNAWQTLNVCRGKVTCVYIGHSDQPLDTSTIYGRFYASIALSLLLYVASLFTPLTIKSSRDSVKLHVKSLKGTSAPIIGVNRVKME